MKLAPALLVLLLITGCDDCREGTVVAHDKNMQIINKTPMWFYHLWIRPDPDGEPYRITVSRGEWDVENGSRWTCPN